MIDFNDLYRWCDDYGGGLVIASSMEEALEKLKKKYGDEERTEFIVWLWKNDDFYDKDNKDVLDIYG